MTNLKRRPIHIQFVHPCTQKICFFSCVCVQNWSIWLLVIILKSDPFVQKIKCFVNIVCSYAHQGCIYLTKISVLYFFMQFIPVMQSWILYIYCFLLSGWNYRERCSRAEVLWVCVDSMSFLRVYFYLCRSKTGLLVYVASVTIAMTLVMTVCVCVYVTPMLSGRLTTVSAPVHLPWCLKTETVCMDVCLWCLPLT